MMPAKKKLWILAGQSLLLWALIFLFAQSAAFNDVYSHSVFPAIQSFKGLAFNILPFSLGDVLYVAAGLWLLLTLVRWVYYLRKWGTHKDKLAGSALNTLNILLFIYVFFLLSWGGNYYKAPLARTWGMPNAKKLSKEARIKKHHNDLVAFNGFLAAQLNKYAAFYAAAPHASFNEKAVVYYREFTDSRVKENGLHIKASMFGPLMHRMGVDGYYNPFTAEGQVNTSQPLFIMPFIICHEMAHQAGIAAEGDANLLAYALCTTVNDPEFRYSAYLNLWLYANNRLYRQDSALAKQFEAKLPTLARNHIDTLEALYRKYHGAVSRYTSDIYDSYLRMQQQEGIVSYGNVVREAWALEQKRQPGGRGLVRIP